MRADDTKVQSQRTCKFPRERRATRFENLEYKMEEKTRCKKTGKNIFFVVLTTVTRTRPQRIVRRPRLEH